MAMLETVVSKQCYKNQVIIVWMNVLDLENGKGLMPVIKKSYRNLYVLRMQDADRELNQSVAH